MNPTQQAHKNLQDLLLTGRILINGMPLTANEMGSLIQNEQMLFVKATQLDKENQLAADKEKAKKEIKKKRA